MTILLDKYSRQVLSENQAVEMLYADPALDVTNLCLEDGDQFNRASKKLHLNMFITQLDEIGVDVEQYHKQNQTSQGISSYRDQLADEACAYLLE